RRSDSRSARAVSPSPQHLSRGNVALSTTTTSRPARARLVAAADPAGPAPTTTTSAVVPTSAVDALGRAVERADRVLHRRTVRVGAGPRRGPAGAVSGARRRRFADGHVDVS